MPAGRRYDHVTFAELTASAVGERVAGWYVRVPDLIAMLRHEAQVTAGRDAQDAITALADGLAGRVVEASR